MLLENLFDFCKRHEGIHFVVDRWDRHLLGCLVEIWRKIFSDFPSKRVAGVSNSSRPIESLDCQTATSSRSSCRLCCLNHSNPNRCLKHFARNERFGNSKLYWECFNLLTDVKNFFSPSLIPSTVSINNVTTFIKWTLSVWNHG